MSSKSLGTEAKLAPKERILSSALKLFVKQGYFNTNIPDISKLSECSVGSIYHHFLNKEEIADLLYRDGIGQFRCALAAVIHDDSSPEENIKSVVIAFLQFAEDHYLLSHYLWLARHKEFIKDRIEKPTMIGFDPLGRKLTRCIKNGIRRNEVPPVKAEIFWSIIFGLPSSFIRDWLEGLTSTSPTASASILADACWSAIEGLNKR